MATITLADINLTTYTLENLPLLRELRDRNLASQTEVCIERARYVTRYLERESSDSEPMETRYAGAVNHYLSNRQALFLDDNLLAGTTTSKRFGAPVYPELTGLTIWPELDTMSNREKNPQRISPEDIEELNQEIFPYWMERNILERTRAKFNNPPCMKLFERIVFFIASKAGTISHTVPCYALALEKGVEFIINQAGRYAAELQAKTAPTVDETERLSFYRAVQTALGGIIAYAANLEREARELARDERDSRRRENLLAMARVCAQVPA